jgi:dolichol-phosphate mannosyltransferase
MEQYCQTTEAQAPQLSIVIPVLNEQGNISPLVDEIDLVLYQRLRFEVIIVDDGSTDGSEEEIGRIVKATGFTHLVRHDSTRGQSAAIRTGIKAARAPVIAVLDGDGQNDPADIPKLYGPLTVVPSVRMVVGHRVRRDDSWVRKLSSRIANGVRSTLLRDGIRDTGCGLKVFYREDFLELPAFDHMHRFLPALIQRVGGRVHAVEVNHRPCTRGRSKYGIGNRLWVGVTDLLGVMWLQKRSI